MDDNNVISLLRFAEDADDGVAWNIPSLRFNPAKSQLKTTSGSAPVNTAMCLSSAVDIKS